MQVYVLGMACIAVWIRAFQVNGHVLANLTYLARKLFGLEP
jgi:hypothetical protein